LGEGEGEGGEGLGEGTGGGLGRRGIGRGGRGGFEINCFYFCKRITPALPSRLQLDVM
jgi:hypothetical protein